MWRTQHPLSTHFLSAVIVKYLKLLYTLRRWLTFFVESFLTPNSKIIFGQSYESLILKKLKYCHISTLQNFQSLMFKHNTSLKTSRMGELEPVLPIMLHYISRIYLAWANLCWNYLCHSFMFKFTFLSS